MTPDKPWHKSKKVFVFLVMTITFLTVVVANSWTNVGKDTISILAGGLVSMGTTLVAVQGWTDRERERTPK